MPFISQEELINGLPNATPEQVLLINWFYATFNNRSAANRTIVNVEPLVYSGPSTATEFLTYINTKLYLCLSISFYHAISGSISIIASSNTFYDENNVLKMYETNSAPYWDATAAAVRFSTVDTIPCQNFYFSRFTRMYEYINFKGYRITLV